MKHAKLPNTEIKVSKLCLGTMTFGNQNTEAEGHEQLSFALDKGVNFIDTAELYPVPATAETYGRTSEIIGSWFKKTGNRDKVVLASKIAGGGDYTAHIRTKAFAESIEEAVNGELKRLQTDYIDLFQLHWPERNTNRFGVRDYTHDSWLDNFSDVLKSLKKVIDSGKVRYVGLSNETPWGTMRYLEEYKKQALPRMITIQNSYSLLNRTFEGGLSEVSLRENIGLLAYSPMAFGVLSGKYIEKKDTPNSRLNLHPRFARYSSEQSTQATKAYLKIAKKYNLSLSQMALAFVNQQPFVTSNIIGATNLTQLKENIESININLGSEVVEEINTIHSRIPNPAP